MASSTLFLVFICLCFVVSSSVATTSPRPILQVTKDTTTLQYVTQISQRTPFVPVKLTLDLGGPYMWVNCERAYTSTTYTPALCGSAPCRLLNTTSCTTGTTCNPPVPDCFNNTCGHGPDNPIANTGTSGQLGADVFKIQASNGRNLVSVLTVPRLYFICGNNFVNDGLASGVTGMAGLGRTGASLPAQLSTYFRFDPKFALCLSRSSGAVFFGDGPYTLLPNVDASSSLTYTPLIVNPVTESGFVGDASPKYFIGVKSIKVNDKRVSGFNQSLLTIDGEGRGGTSISTAAPYTVLETTIYKALVAAFVKAMPKNVQKVANVAPFGACFNSNNIGSTRLGPAVPSIDLELLQSKNVWRINGANSMVAVSNNVLCLGFVEARTDFAPVIPVIIGGHQIEDNLLQFDLSRSRLGFSSSLLGRSTTCANFNFTSL
ncbi:putative nepenthesin [Helianthus anomalus]